MPKDETQKLAVVACARSGGNGTAELDLHNVRCEVCRRRGSAALADVDATDVIAKLETVIDAVERLHRDVIEMHRDIDLLKIHYV